MAAMTTKAPAPPGTSRSLVWPIAIVLIVVLGVVAVLAARNSNASGDGGDYDAAAQTSTVTVEGDALVPYLEGAGDKAVGQTIPTVTGKDFDRKPISIGPDDGAQVIMVVAHWCPHCQAELPRILSHLDDAPMPADVDLQLLSTSVKPDADNYPPQTWIEGEGWDQPVLADSTDSEASTALGLTAFPYFVAVTSDGKVAARTSGEITDDQFDELVKAAQGS